MKRKSPIPTARPAGKCHTVRVGPETQYTLSIVSALRRLSKRLNASVISCPLGLNGNRIEECPREQKAPRNQQQPEPLINRVQIRSKTDRRLFPQVWVSSIGSK